MGLGRIAFHVRSFVRHCVQYKQAMLSVDFSSTTLHSVAESVTRARNLMDRSRQGGTFRRLGSNERRRSQIPRGGTKGKPKRDVQTKSIKEKPFEFALLNTKEDDTEDDFLKKEMVVKRGIVTLGEQDGTVQDYCLLPFMQMLHC